MAVKKKSLRKQNNKNIPKNEISHETKSESEPDRNSDNEKSKNKDKIIFDLNHPIEAGRKSFLDYVSIYVGDSEELLENAKNIEVSKIIARANALRVIRLQIEKIEKEKFKITQKKAIEFFDLYINENK